MNIASMPGPAMMAPLHNLLRWLLPAASKSEASPATSVCQRGSSAAMASATRPPWVSAHDPVEAGSVARRRPLRVVRLLEAGQTPAQVGRMVISGRMSDVCAELDRLAAREAALH
ncbi:MAG: hypothetical protein RLZ81_2758 [Pseudomonadota bacterium]|jgi:hypothetical protein